jgi:hypothetical protein
MLPHRTLPQMYMANFDSTASMLRAVSSFLEGSAHSNMGVLSERLAPLLARLGLLVNRLPQSWRESIYTFGGATETVSPRRLDHFDADRLAAWKISQYPERPYPAVMLGSSNGAMVHLCAALGIPWLPQTFLMPVRRGGVHPDEPWQDFAWSKEPARRFLEANPDLELHHMIDPVQDLLMSRVLAYFRLKRLRLGPSYERFLRKNLQPGGTIFLLECELKWPCTKVGERHFFQFGAPGGATHEDLFEGTPRVEAFLQRYGSYRPYWDPPEPDTEAPEAEWGFAPQLREDVERFADQHGYRICRVVFGKPEDMSPLVADFYRAWHRSRGLLANRMIVESFLLVEPYWTLRVGAVPYWLVFPTEPQDRYLETYLDKAEPFDEIGMMLFSHGVDSVGLVPIERWRQLLGRARKRGFFVGVDEQAYPRDFAAMFRYHTDFKEKFSARYPLPGPLPLSRLEEFVAESGRKYEVRLEELGAGSRVH